MKQNKLEVIECRGTPYEIGRQYGKAARENIVKSKDLVFSSLKNGIFKIPEQEVRRVSRMYLENVRAFDPEAVEWVKGIAEGAGISFEESFALKCSTEISVSYPQLAGMCTSFAVSGPMTKNKTTILGQNIDWHPDAPIDLLRIRHTDGLEQLCLCLTGNSLYYLNSSGLGNCANLTLCPMGPVSMHLPLPFYLWKAMRQQHIADAMEILQNSARGIAYYHLADRNGNIGGIESVYDDYTVIQATDNTLVHANHYETEKYKDRDLAHTYIQDSFGRKNRLRQMILNASGEITPELMMKFLSDHQGYPKSVCSHIDEAKPPEMASMSIGSFVMVPEELKMYISFGPPCKNEYHEYSLRD